MTWLIVGLALFLGAHSVRILAPGVRDGVIARAGAGAWKGLYSLVSLAGFILLIVGFGRARGAAPLYAPAPGLVHGAFLLVWLGFIGLTAAYAPANHIKRALGDPMVFGVGLWALGHLLANGRPADLVLFGAFLAWSIVEYAALRARARAAGTPPPEAKALNTVLTIVIGTALAGAFAMWLHRILIGVSPFG